MSIIRNIDQCVQGSEEWLKLRLGVATASNFDKIITTTGKESESLKKYALQLATELMLETPEPSFKNDVMARGNELESLARETYQEQTFNVVEQITMFKSDCGNFGYSPDGLVDDDGLVEIKCPIATTHFKYLLDNKMPTDYWQQVQGGLWVSQRKWIDFVSFNSYFKDKKLFVIRVERDEEYIAKLAELANKVILLRDEYLNKLEGKYNV
jgi:putative phage-type endonuclease